MKKSATDVTFLQGNVIKNTEQRKKRIAYTSETVFLAHYVGGGIPAVLDLNTYDFIEYMEAAVEQYKAEAERPVNAIVLGFKDK